MGIVLLPPQVANQIAAGEVVESPSAVVKELMENSFDAGATAVQVEIEKGGIKRILIRDNGCGIAKDELALALQRHATSKIKTIDDLDSLLSMGFRGEALASIAAVSRLTLTSRSQDASMAYAVNVEGIGQEAVVTPSAHPIGTSIEVCDLFFNTPARRRFVRSEKTEFMAIEEIFKRLALARMDIALSLKHNNKVIYDLKAVDKNNTQQLRKRLAQIMSPKFAQEAKEFSQQTIDLAMRGYIELTSTAKPQCYFFLNGRIIRDKVVQHAMKEAFTQEVGQAMSVSYVCFLTMDAKEVDVNVHPQKYAVRFRDSRAVHDFIYNVITNIVRQEQQVLPESFAETSTVMTDHQYGDFKPLKTDAQKVDNFIQNLDNTAKTTSTTSTDNPAQSRYDKMFHRNSTSSGFAHKTGGNFGYFAGNTASRSTIKQDLNYLQQSSAQRQQVTASPLSGEELVAPSSHNYPLSPKVTDSQQEKIAVASTNAETSNNAIDEPLSILCPWLNQDADLATQQPCLYQILQLTKQHYAVIIGQGVLWLVDLQELAKALFIERMSTTQVLQANRLLATINIPLSAPLQPLTNPDVQKNLKDLGFHITSTNKAIEVTTVPALVRQMNLTNVVTSLSRNIDSNAGIRELQMALAKIVLVDVLPSYFSMAMAQAMLRGVQYEAFWQEHSTCARKIDVDALIKEKFGS